MTVSRSLLSLFLLTASFAFSGCKHDAPAEESDQTALAGIKVSTVRLQNSTDVLSLPGRVEADPAQLVHIYAPLSGRLLSMTLVPGQEVRKGPVRRVTAVG